MILKCIMYQHESIKTISAIFGKAYYKRSSASLLIRVYTSLGVKSSLLAFCALSICDVWYIIPCSSPILLLCEGWISGEHKLLYTMYDDNRPHTPRVYESL